MGSDLLPFLLLSGGLGGGGGKKKKRRKVQYVQTPAQPYSGQGDYNPQPAPPPAQSDASYNGQGPYNPPQGPANSDPGVIWG